MNISIMTNIVSIAECRQLQTDLRLKHKNIQWSWKDFNLETEFTLITTSPALISSSHSGKVPSKSFMFTPMGWRPSDMVRFMNVPLFDAASPVSACFHMCPSQLYGIVVRCFCGLVIPVVGACAVVGVTGEFVLVLTGVVVGGAFCEALFFFLM